MAKCNRSQPAGFRLWPSFSPALLTRRLLEAVTCGASCARENHNGPLALRPFPGRPGRLIELLQEDASDSESSSDEAADAEAELKIEAFEELQHVVVRLQLDGRNAGRDGRGEAAADARRLAKDEPEARETLAMLGAIPPLAALLNSDDSGALIDALYALLNLGIGNEL